MSGIVYFFKHNGIDGVKIGYTKSESCKSRFDSFSMYSPMGATIMGTIATKDPFSLEKEIHKKLKNKNLNGEFFDITENEVKKIIATHSVPEYKFQNNIEILKSIFSGDKLPIEKKEELNKLVKKAISTVLEEPSTEEELSEIEKKILQKISPQKSKTHLTLYKLTSTEIIDRYSFDSISAVKIGIILKKHGFTQKICKVNGSVRRLYTIYELTI